jgi:hypothetical protein
MKTYTIMVHVHRTIRSLFDRYDVTIDAEVEVQCTPGLPGNRESPPDPTDYHVHDLFFNALTIDDTETGLQIYLNQSPHIDENRTIEGRKISEWRDAIMDTRQLAEAAEDAAREEDI